MCPLTRDCECLYPLLMQLRKRPWESLNSESGAEMRVAQVATQAARSSLSDVFRARKQGVRLPPGAKANIVTAVGLKISATTPATPAEQNAKPASRLKAALPQQAGATEAVTGPTPPQPRPQRRQKAKTEDSVAAEAAAPVAKPRRKRTSNKAAAADVTAAEPDVLAGMEAETAAPLPLPPLSLDSVHVGCAHLSAADPGGYRVDGHRVAAAQVPAAFLPKQLSPLASWHCMIDKATLKPINIVYTQG